MILKLDEYCIKNKFKSIFLINSPYIYHEELNHSLQRVKEFNSEQELDLSSPSEFYNE